MAALLKTEKAVGPLAVRDDSHSGHPTRQSTDAGGKTVAATGDYSKAEFERGFEGFSNGQSRQPMESATVRNGKQRPSIAPAGGRAAGKGIRTAGKAILTVSGTAPTVPPIRISFPDCRE